MASYLKILLLLCLLSITSQSYAGKIYNSQTGINDYCLTIEDESGSVVNNTCKKIQVPDGALELDGNIYILRTGISTYSYTSMTSSQTAINASYSLIRKSIASDPAFQTGTLPNGARGKIITIQVTECPTGASWTLTPTTKTGFTSLIFENVGDIATLLYVDDTTGWIRLTLESVQSL